MLLIGVSLLITILLITSKKSFWKRLWDEKIDTHIILGNHDTYYRNTNNVNAMQQLITTFDGVNEPFIYEKPKTVNFDGLDILFLPWIAPDIEEESIYAIDNSNAQIAMGHLELKVLKCTKDISMTTV